MSARKRRTRPQEEPVVVEVEPEPDPATAPAPPPRAKRRKPANPVRCPPSLVEQARGLNVKQPAVLQRLYDALRNLREEPTNRLLCSAFLRLPNRKSFPQYYDCIAAPIDLTRIQHRLKFSEYPTLAALIADFELLISNARLFFPMTSQEAKDASALEAFLQSQLEELWAIERQGGKAKSPGETPISPKSSVGGLNPISPELLSPPGGGGGRRSKGGSGKAQLRESVTPKSSLVVSKGQAVPTPDSSSKRSRGKLPTYAGMEGDTDSGGVEREEVAGSQGKGGARKKGQDLHKDASAGFEPELISGPTDSKKSRKRKSDKGEVVAVAVGDESGTEVGAPLSAKAKKKKSETSGKEDTSLTVKIPLTEQLKSSREKGEAVTPKEGLGRAAKKTRLDLGEVLMSIFDVVISKQDVDGRVLSDIFMVRPSRKLYPEYYLVIPHPIDLKEIRSKIAATKYSTAAAFFEDMNTLFKNAQLFNEETALIHYDSITLSCLTCYTLRELWKEKAPNTGEDLEEVLAIMTSAKRPASFHIPGQKGQFVLSIKAHVFLGLPRGDLFKWYPDMKVPTTAEERKTIVKQGVCASSAMAHRVIPVEDLESFYVLKEKGLTGRQLLKLQLADYVPHSMKHQAGSSEEEEGEGEGKMEIGNGTGEVGEVQEDEANLSEDAKMCRDLLRAIRQAKTTSGRLISATFQQIPTPWNKAEHSYSVVRKIIDLRTITEKHSRGHYSKFDELLDDLHLMCTVACRLSAPNSQHYNDSILLHSFVLRKKHELLKGASWRSRKVNARERVQSILRRIIKHTVRAKGPSSSTPGGRVMKTKLPPSANSEQEEEILDLNTIVTNVNQGKYHQLGRMQDDLMGLLDYLRHSSQPGSQTHSDAIDLTRSYIKYRNKLTGDGARLYSPALSKLRSSTFEMELQGEVGLVGPSRGVAPSDGQDGAGSGEGKEQTSEERPLGEGASLEEGTELESAKGLLPDDGGEVEKRKFVTEAEHNGCTYHVGDYVCVPSRYPGKPHHVITVEHLWQHKDTGEYWFTGMWFFWPEETFHVATRKFYEKELFKTEFNHMMKLSQVLRRCHVMFIKDYPKYYPEGFDDDDVYVCESRYIYKVKVFKKYKTWSTPAGRQPKLILRGEPVVVKRVPSVFAVEKEEAAKTEDGQLGDSQAMDREERGEAGKDREERGGAGKDREERGGAGKDGEERAGEGKLYDSDLARDSSSDDETKVVNMEDGREEEYIDYDWENVEVKDPTPEPDCTYYEQFVIDGNRFRLGDYVFVRSEEARPYIARIDRMWTDGNKDPWFHGPWFVHPDEVEHVPTRMFYHNEVFQSNIQDTNPMRSVIGRCAVMTVRDYCKWRPTEVFEDDVFVCENKYNERDKEIRRLKGLKTFTHSSAVLADEVYYFEEELPVTKVPSSNLHDILRLNQAPVVQPGPPPSHQPAAAHPLTPTLTTPGPAHPLKVQPPAKLTAQPPLEKGVESFPDEKYMETMLSESSIVASAMVFMAEDIQKQLSGRGLSLPLDVINNVVANEWASMTDEQRLPYQRKAVIFRVAHTAAVSGIKMPPVTVATSVSVSAQIASVLQHNLGSQASESGGSKSLTLSSIQANAPVLTQATASNPAQSTPTVTASSGGGVKVGGVTLSPGMTLTQKHIQHLQQIMVHAQQLAATHKMQAAAVRSQQGATTTTTTASVSAPHSSKVTPQFLDDDASKVIHTILYLKYLDDLKKGMRQMSTWEAATTSKELAPNPEAISRISSWINPKLATDGDTANTQGTSSTQEQAPPTSAPLETAARMGTWIEPRTQQSAIIEALKRLHDHMMQQSVDIANLVKKIE